MDILLTGASGFVGLNLKPFLQEKGFKVIAFSLRGNWESQMPTNYNAIIHLAGKAHDTKNTSSPEEYFQVNTELTKQLFDRFMESNARDFIYFSSVKAVADSVATILTEEALPNPKTPYGQSKWQAEQYLNSQPLHEGKRLFILRPCMIHGPGNKGNLNLLYQAVTKGIPYPLAAFDNRRSFLSIANLQFVIKWILKNPDIPGGTYHLADDEVLSTNELIKLIGEVHGKNARLWKLPPTLIKGIARLGDTVKLPLNTERLQKLTEDYVVSNKKIKEALKVERLPMAVRDGFFATFRKTN